MNISIPPELRAIVQAEVKSGFYTSESEVVRDAIRVWHEHRVSRRELLRDMHADLIASVEEANNGELIDGADVVARLRARTARARELTSD